MSRFAVKIIFLFFLAYLPSALFAICPRAWAENRDLSFLQAGSAGKRVALVIGNGDYQNVQKLPNPTHDAEDIAAALRGFGFEVIERKNQSKEEMGGAITEFSHKLGNSEAALFYFAGHAIQMKGQNYLIPVNAKIETEAQVQYESVNVNRILDEMENARNRANIVILDACRNNPIDGKFRSVATRGLAAPDSQPEGTVIVYATAPGEVAFDGKERNGLFTAGLLTAFKGSDLSLDGVLTLTSSEVERASERAGQKKQTPYVTGPKTLEKNFYFASIQQPPPPPQPVILSPKKELLYAALKIGTNPSGAEIFIDGKRVGDTQGGYLVWEQYPVGEYTVKASKKGYYEKEAMLRLRKEGETLIIDMDPSSPQPKPSPPAPPAPKVSPVTQAQEGMVFVKGDCFLMGDQFDDGKADEKPVHEVCVDDFYMDKHEVTQKNFQSVMGGNKNCDGCPVASVTWDEAKGYCEDARAGKRLPTEAEWEFAAREGGKKVRFGTGKDTIGPDEANFDARADYKKPYSRTGEYREKTLPVGSFDPNALGLYDMSGNVWEWVSDWYDENYYRSSPKDNPQGPSSGEYRVLRGGSWDYGGPGYLRAAGRGWSGPARRNNNGGFRCVRPVR
jgi:formylglycine-generating enzyme required for sulfatase activity